MLKTQGKRNDPYYIAQDILSRRDHAVEEVRAKLRRKGFSAAQIEAVIIRLQARKLLNDQQFAVRYSESTLRAKPVGRRWLRYKLKQRGIADPIVEETLGEFFTPDRERELVRRAATSWRRQHPRHRDDTPRLQRFLASRGFSFETIQSASDESAPQPAGE